MFWKGILHKGPRTKKSEQDDFDGRETVQRTTVMASRRGSMVNLLKAHLNNDDRYSGLVKDNLERNFMLFLERGVQADIPEEERRREFSIMLMGLASQLYFYSLMKKYLSIEEIEMAVKSRFQTPERIRALLREWKSLSLKSLMISRLNKLPSTFL